MTDSKESSEKFPRGGDNGLGTWGVGRDILMQAKEIIRVKARRSERECLTQHGCLAGCGKGEAADGTRKVSGT